MTTPVLASTVTTAHEITETETPEGPWYRVAKVNRRSLVLDVDGLTVRIPFDDGSQVLARPAV